MKKIRCGQPEKIVPSIFCKGFTYKETEINYPFKKIKFKENARGCTFEFPIESGERFFGLGLQLKAFELTGKKYVTRVNADPVAETGDSHAPVPFFVSNKGYGIYIDTARYVEFDFGRKPVYSAINAQSDSKIATDTSDLYRAGKATEGSVITVQIPAAKGADVYIIEGKNITEVVAQYNMLAGGGCEVPEWGLGTIYRCCATYSQEKVLETARYFKEKGMPISVIGLEPGWQTRAYSCSFLWNEGLYPDPKSMIDKLYADGYHINLWEHAFTHPDSPLYKKLLPYSGNYEVWNGIVPDFSTEEARKIFAEYHRENITFGKIDGFKLDECDGSDYTNGWSFPLCSEFSGEMDGEQYHSLFGTLYMQTMLSVTGETLSEVRSAGALCSSYPFVLYSDLYDYKDFLRGLATCGFSGLLWTAEVRDAKNAEEFLKRLQMTVFSPQSLINGWYCEELPWKDFGIEKEVEFWLNERVKLIPKLKKAFDEYKRTGKPVIRALVSDYTDDEEVYKLDDEYLFCDDLLVAPAFLGEKGRKVYIPIGDWENYFSGKEVSCGWHEIKTDRISVFKKKQITK